MKIKFGAFDPGVTKRTRRELDAITALESNAVVFRYRVNRPLVVAVARAVDRPSEARTVGDSARGMSARTQRAGESAGEDVEFTVASASSYYTVGKPTRATPTFHRRQTDPSS